MHRNGHPDQRSRIKDTHTTPYTHSYSVLTTDPQCELRKRQPLQQTTPRELGIHLEKTKTGLLSPKLYKKQFKMGHILRYIAENFEAARENP